MRGFAHLKLWISLVVLGLATNVSAWAQDAQFTQLYASPLYGNPAFTGSLKQHRIAANFRNQWSGVPAPLVAYNASFDTYVDKYNSGLGVLLHRQSNSGAWNTTAASALYSFHLPISREWSVAAGTQLGYVWRNANVSNLTFGYQSVGNGQYTAVKDPLQAASAQKRYFDMAVGFLAYSERAWFGLASHHLTRPDIGLENVDKQPIRYTLNAGYVMPLQDVKLLKKNQEVSRSLTPVLQFRHQGAADQLDLGVYLHYEALLAGMWYRGLPIKKGFGTINQDALAFMLGTQINSLTLGYSYDLAISGVTNAAGGSHEIGLVYLFGDPHQRRGPGLPCPKF